jgi:putative ABC transport system permease protein
MLLYHLRIAAKSLRRNPFLSTLLIFAVALGICIATSFTTLRHVLAKDPLPRGRSEVLHYVRMDNWDPKRAYNADDPKSLPTQVSYRDARVLLESKIPTRQTATYSSNFFVFPDPKIGRPYPVSVRLVFSDFFPMFAVPFQYGSGWDKAADAKPEQIIVIDHDTNEKLFAGRNSVGRSVRLGDRVYRVAGVLAPWRPAIRMYDVTNARTVAPEPIYMPFNFTPLLKLRTNGNSDGWKGGFNTYEQFLQVAEQCWIQYWVELPDAPHVAAYKQFLDNYVMDQKKHGRFERPLHTEVTPMLQLFKEFRVVPPQVSGMAVVSLLFLLVCSLNLVGVILGKFLSRAPEVSVRRALGATRRDVFLQHILECELIGLIGGPIGIGLSYFLVAAAAKFLPGNVPLHLDVEMIVTAVVLSLGAGFVAGLYPAWRICSIAPAMQLKIQ